MYTVKVGKGEEALDRALKKLKSKIMEDGLMDVLYSKRAYENPRERKIRKERLRHKKAKMLKQRQ